MLNNVASFKINMNYPHGKLTVTHKVVLVESVSQSANLRAEQQIRQAYTANWQGIILLYEQPGCTVKIYKNLN